MSRRLARIPSVLVIGLCVLALAASAGHGLAAKKPLSYDAYDGWRSIQGTQLSRDGQWLVYALVPQDGDGELVALNLKTNKEYRSPRGKQPTITVDGKFVVFTVAPLKAEVDKAKKDKKKPEEQPKAGLGIMDLATGDVTTVERVKSFKVPEESGIAVAYLMEPPAKKDEEKKDEAKKEEVKKEPEAEKPEPKPGEPKKEGAAKKRRKRRKRRSPARTSSSGSSPRARRRGSPRSSSTPGRRTAPGWPMASPRRRRRTTALSPGRRPRGRRSRCSKGSGTTRASPSTRRERSSPSPATAMIIRPTSPPRSSITGPRRRSSQPPLPGLAGRSSSRLARGRPSPPGWP